MLVSALTPIGRVDVYAGYLELADFKRISRRISDYHKQNLEEALRIHLDTVRDY